jgi:hypothetical protein
MNGSGQWAECGADPTSVGAVSAERVGSGAFPLVPSTGSYEFPPGYCRGFKVTNEQEFEAGYTGTRPSQLGGSYGVVKGADGLWRVDFTDTTNTVVKLVRFSHTLGRDRVVVVFLATDVQVV